MYLYSCICIFVYCYISVRERQVFLVMWGVSSPVKTLPGAPGVQPLNFSSSRLVPPRLCVCTFMHIHLNAPDTQLNFQKLYLSLQIVQSNKSNFFTDWEGSHEQKSTKTISGAASLMQLLL